MTIFNHLMSYLLLGKYIGDEHEMGLQLIYTAPEKGTEQFSASFFLRLTDLIVRVVADVRYLSMELYFLALTVTMWLIGCDFNSIVCQTVQLTSQKSNYRFRCKCFSLVKQYKSISRLSRKFSRIFGYRLFLYILVYIIYYSVGLNNFLMPLPIFQKLYEVKFLLLFLANMLFSVGFSKKVFASRLFLS